MSTTEDRIEFLENQLRDQREQIRIQQSQARRQRRWNIALSAAVVVGGLMAATGVRSVPHLVQAKKFEVVDHNGKVLVEIGQKRMSKPRFGEGEEGKVYGNWGYVETKSSKNQVLVQLDRTIHGHGTVTTVGDTGYIVTHLGATEDGEGLVRTESGEGRLLTELGVTTTGNGTLKTQTKNGMVLVKLGASDSGAGSIMIQNAKGIGLVKIGVTKNSGNGAIWLQDRNGRPTKSLQ